MPDAMTEAEREDGEALIAAMQDLVRHYHPAVVYWALLSALATLIATRADVPETMPAKVMRDLAWTLAHGRQDGPAALN